MKEAKEKLSQAKAQLAARVGEVQEDLRPIRCGKGCGEVQEMRYWATEAHLTILAVDWGNIHRLCL